jgi:serine/threonine protein kinase
MTFRNANGTCSSPCGILLYFAQGAYIPERENVKIPVAIKELSEGSNPHSNNELLEEARVMATVIHPCCIRIMAVCLTKQLMLITPLMPLGSLLDYLRRNRSNIGSRSLLSWCQQIAEVALLNRLCITVPGVVFD